VRIAIATRKEDCHSGALATMKRQIDLALHAIARSFGVGLELMTASIPGGTCLARVRFQDGQLRLLQQRS